MEEFAIWKQLRKLRHSHGLTLKMLSSRVGYGTGNLSTYETGVLKAIDPTLLRILTRGYKMSQKEARQMIAHWRQAELEVTYKMALAQPKSTKQEQKQKTLDEYLAEEGLNRTGIQKVKQLIKEYKQF